MPTRGYIILLSGLFLGLFFLSFSAKAQNETSIEPLSASVTITGENVFCEGEHTISTLTAIPSFTFHRFVWSNGNTTDLTITIEDITTTQTFSIEFFDENDDPLGGAQRTVFITTRPVVTEANRINDMLCEGENRAAIVGMQNTSANYFVWWPDTIRSPHMINDDRNVWPYVHLNPINLHVWYQNNPNRVARTVLTVQMSTHPITGYDNRCYTIDSAFIEIQPALFDLVANTTQACIDDTITLNIVGSFDINSIVWSNGKVGETSTKVTVTDVGDTIFYVRGTDLTGCQGVSYVSVFGMPSPENVYIRIVGDDPTVCEGLPTRLTVDCPNCESFLWITGHTTEEIEIWPTGRFTYSVRAFGGPNHTMCSSVAELEVVAINCENILFPTAIRLSSQIGNNVWRPVFGVEGPIEGTDYWFAIFNQWGQLIFESDDMNVGWDGTHNGQFVRPGTYVFLFRLSHVHRTWERTGTITVID